MRCPVLFATDRKTDRRRNRSCVGGISANRQKRRRSACSQSNPCFLNFFLFQQNSAAIILTGGTIMGSGFGGLSFSQIVNTALYVVSGFFFGIFASRNSIFSALHIRKVLAEKDFSAASLFKTACSVLFIVLAFLVFPSWMASRTTAGAFAYYAVLLFYFSKGWKNLSGK